MAKPGLDGHDRGAKVIARALREAGMEVIYTGLRSNVEAIVQAAVQEDVDLVGLSLLSGAHKSVCARLLERLKEEGMEDVPVVIGGVIPRKDHEALSTLGVAAVFGQEDAIDSVVKECRRLAEARRAAEEKS
ncbi:MAG: cobalamin B12-binding domain-containing protein [Nitrospinota bacterium]